MKKTIKMTRQWQIHIPKEFREALDLKPGTQFTARLKGKKVILEPDDAPILKLAGKYSKQHQENPIDLDNIRDYIDYSDLP